MYAAPRCFVASVMGGDDGPWACPGRTTFAKRLDLSVRQSGDRFSVASRRRSGCFNAAPASQSNGDRPRSVAAESTTLATLRVPKVSRDTARWRVSTRSRAPPEIPDFGDAFVGSRQGLREAHRMNKVFGRRAQRRLDLCQASRRPVTSSDRISTGLQADERVLTHGTWHLAAWMRPFPSGSIVDS